MTQVRLYCGPNRSERSVQIDRIMGEHWGRAVLLVPARAYAARRRERLILEGRHPGVWGNPVWPLTDFAEALLRSEGLWVRRLDDFQRRLLLEACLARLGVEGRLGALEASADTAGLTNHLLRVITQLKQAAIEPEAFRRQVNGGPASPYDAAIAGAYEAYQQAMKEAGAYDVPGLYWEAESRCRSGTPKALEAIDAVLLDGFDDFTPSEFRFIESIEPRVATLVFGLDFDERPDRADLYSLPAATAKRIATRFEVTPIPVEAPAPKRYSEYAASTIFWRDVPKLPDGLDRDLAIMPCGDLYHEIECIGRRVKTLILDAGAAPDSIAVVFRDWGEAAGVVRAVFAEFGIPARFEYRPSLAQSAVGAFLLRFFEATETWAREAVVDALCSPCFPPGREGNPEVPPLNSSRIPLLVRNAQIIAGHEEWNSRLQALLFRLSRKDADDPLSRIPDVIQSVQDLLDQVAYLEELGRVLPERGSPARFAEALDLLLDRLGIASAIETFPQPLIAEVERGAFQILRRLVVTLAEADPSAITRQEFLKRLAQGLRETACRWPDATGGVACLEAASLRNVPFDHVFFGGLNEGAVPMPPAVNALYSEADLDRLREAGIVLEGRLEHSARERLLFHHVLAAARKEITLSWRLLKEGGREASPSPFLADVKELFPTGSVEEPMPHADSYLPHANAIASQRDLRNLAFYRCPDLRMIFPEYCGSVSKGLRIEAQRHDNAPFGIYDGVLAAPDLIAGIAGHYGEAHEFSAHQLERYGNCPFLFFVERILGVEAFEQPEAEFDPRTRGLILHAVLEAFHRHYRGVPVPEIPEEEAQALLPRLVEQAFDQHAWRSGTAPPGVAVAERRHMQTRLQRYLHIEQARGEHAWKPEHFEVSFGRSRGSVRDPLSRRDPFLLDTALGTVRFSGRIDRVDRSGNEARIVDYKSGGLPAAKEINHGLSLQLAVYAWALEHFFFEDTPCAEAYFVHVGRDERREALGTGPRQDRAKREERVQQAIVASVKGIRAGRFPPVPAEEGCRFCGWAHACRYEQARIERKEGPDFGDEAEEDRSERRGAHGR